MPKKNAKVVPPREQVKDLKGTVKRFLKYMGTYKIGMIIGIILSIVGVYFTIVGPKIMGNATTVIFEGLMDKVVSGGPGIDFNKLKSILIMLLIFYITSMVINLIVGVIMSFISQKISFNLRRDISLKINKLPMDYFDSKTHGDTLSTITNDVDNLTNSLSDSITQLISSVVTMLGVVVMMFSINWLMATISLVIIPISVFGLGFIMKRSQKYFTMQQDYISKINSKVEESYGGHNIIKAFNREDLTVSEFKETNEVLYQAGWKSQFFSGLMRPIMNFVSNFAYVVIVILGGYLTIQSRITVGDILSFTQYIRLFMNPLAQIAMIMSTFQSAFASAERVFDLLEEKEEVSDPVNYVDTSNIKGDVAFSNVSFGYKENEEIIHDFSIKVKQGQKIAIVGPTGAGKTTLVKLLMRFYDINKGTITIDGADTKDMRRRDLRSLFGMVLQDTWLFNDTVMNNIRYGNLNATDEEVIKAATYAHVDHFVNTLSGGYEMVIDEEATNISEGQKQLLTIARVILADPRILILDEATSNVDTRTEVLIQEAMDRLMKGRTSFIIAHRLSTIRNADTILVLNEGDIVEQGNHEELLKKKGFYYKLYNSQFEEE